MKVVFDESRERLCQNRGGLSDSALKEFAEKRRQFLTRIGEFVGADEVELFVRIKSPDEMSILASPDPRTQCIVLKKGGACLRIAITGDAMQEGKITLDNWGGKT